jgi:hypothetical protein
LIKNPVRKLNSYGYLNPVDNSGIKGVLITANLPKPG